MRRQSARVHRRHKRVRQPSVLARSSSSMQAVSTRGGAAQRRRAGRTLVSSGRRTIKGVDRRGDPDDVAWRKKSAHTSHGSERAGALACLKNYGIERLQSRGETHHGALAHPWLPRPARRCRRSLSQHRVRVRVPACPPCLVLEREQLESQRR